MKSVKKHVLSFCLLFLAVTIQAQNSSLQGTITNEKTGQGIDGAEVFVQPINRGTITNAHGLYSLSGLVAGEYTVVVHFVGFERKEVMVKLPKSGVVTLNIAISSRIIPLPAVTVTDQVLKSFPYVKNYIAQDVIEKSVSYDIGQAMRLLPNVGGIRKGGTNLDPVIRGLKFDQLNVIMDDGIKIEGGCPNRMDPTTSHISAEDVEAIEVIKGPYALRYGPAFGGLVNIKTFNPQFSVKPKISGSARRSYVSSWDGTKTSARVNISNEKLSLLITGNESKYGNYLDGNGDVQRSQFDKFAYGAKLGFAPSPNHKLFLSYHNSFGKNIWFGALPMDERVDDTRIYAFDYEATSLTKSFHKLTAKVFLSDVDHEMDNKERSFGDTVAAISILDATKLGYRVEGAITAGKGMLFIGSDGEKIWKDGDRLKYMIGQFPNPMDIVPLKVENLWHDAEIMNLGLFSEYKLPLGHFDIILAARLDKNTASSDSISLTNMGGVDIIGISADSTKSDFLNFSFSGGISKQLTEKASIGLSFGRGVRSPNMLERFIIKLPVGFDKYEYLGNPSLKPEINNEVDLTLNHDCKKSGHFQFNVFYSYIQNYITGKLTNQLPLTNTVKGVKQFYNAEPVNLMGAELVYVTPQRFPWELNLTAAYTYGVFSSIDRHVYNASGQVIDEETLTGDPLNEINPFEAKMVFRYRLLNDKLVPQISLRAVAAQNRISEAFYEEATPGFLLSGFGLSYEFKEFLVLHGGVNNIFDVAYYEHLNRRIIGSPTKIYEPGRSFFINVMIKF